jgi:hypothetical protein
MPTMYMKVKIMREIVTVSFGFFFFFQCWGLEPRFSHMVGKCFSIEVHPEAHSLFLKSDFSWFHFIEPSGDVLLVVTCSYKHLNYG